MRVPRLHLPVSLTVGATISLNEAAFNHAVRVLRLKPGAPLVLFNGAGGEFHAVLEGAKRREATVRIKDFVPRESESPLEVMLVQGVSKGERMDYTLQKAVELGITAILPLLTARSVANLQGERLERRLQHWRGVLIGACEQSGRNRLPLLLRPVGLQSWLQEYHHQGLSLMLDPLAERGLASLAPSIGPITLLVGPEGGLTPKEIALAERARFTGIRLGPRIMRTETAAIVALAALQVLWGDLGKIQ